MFVYKYYSFENEFSISNLENGIIYFALAKQWEPDNEIEFEYKMNTYEELYEFCLNDIKELKKDNKVHFEDKMYSHPYQLENFHRFCSIEEIASYDASSFLINKKRNEKYYRSLLLKSVRIFCTSKSNENNYLWKKFAYNSSGYCVGYDSSSWDIGCGIVDYSDEIPIIDFLSIKEEGNPRKYYPLYRLPKEYNVEQEIRFIKVLDGKERKHEEECKVKLNPIDIVSITAGINIEHENLEKLKAIAQLHYPHIQVKVGMY